MRAVKCSHWDLPCHSLSTQTWWCASSFTLWWTSTFSKTFNSSFVMIEDINQTRMRNPKPAKSSVKAGNTWLSQTTFWYLSFWSRQSPGLGIFGVLFRTRKMTISWLILLVSSGTSQWYFVTRGLNSRNTWHARSFFIGLSWFRRLLRSGSFSTNSRCSWSSSISFCIQFSADIFKKRTWSYILTRWTSKSSFSTNNSGLRNRSWSFSKWSNKPKL